MDQLSVDTVPLAVVPTPGRPQFVVRVDEQTGSVHLDPA